LSAWQAVLHTVKMQALSGAQSELSTHSTPWTPSCSPRTLLHPLDQKAPIVVAIARDQTIDERAIKTPLAR
jgi:hypothetical protein